MPCCRVDVSVQDRFDYWYTWIVCEAISIFGRGRSRQQLQKKPITETVRSNLNEINS